MVGTYPSRISQMASCCQGVRDEANGGHSRKKTTQLRTDGATSVRASVGALWGPKQLDNLVDLDLPFEVVPEKSVLRRRREEDGSSIGNQYVHRGLDLHPHPFF
jgi:hypothetical protein